MVVFHGPYQTGPAAGRAPETKHHSTTTRPGTEYGHSDSDAVENILSVSLTICRVKLKVREGASSFVSFFIASVCPAVLVPGCPPGCPDGGCQDIRERTEHG